MNVAQMLGFYQENKPRSRERTSEANPDYKPEFIVTESSLAKHIGQGSVDASTLAIRMDIKKNYASRVLREYCASGFLELVGTKLGPNGGQPVKLYRVKK